MMSAQTIGLTVAYTLCILLTIYLAYSLTNKIFKSKQSKAVAYISLLVWACMVALSSYYIHNVPIVYMITFVGGVILYSFIFQFTMFQSYLSSCFILFHLIALKGITIGVMSLVLKENSFMILENRTTEMISIIVSQLLNIMMMFVYLRVVNVKEVRTFLLNKKQLSFTLICHLIITVFMLFNSFTFYYNLDLVWISVAQILVGVILYFVYIIILCYGIKTADFIQHKLRDQKQLETIQMQMRQQNSLLRMSEIINVFKHDYREHMLMIEDHIENGRTLEAMQEVKRDCLYHLAELPQSTKYSNNIILNSLLIDRQAACDTLDIKMEALLYYPLDLSISEKEYHEVIRILSDNAIEANEKVKKGKRHLTIKSNVEKQWLSIVIKNAYDGLIHYENDIPVSSYDDEDRGMGLVYVEELMNEHHGLIHFEEDREHNEFKVVVLIRIEAEEGDI